MDSDSLLSRIDGPQDLRGLSEEDLARLAQEIRRYIIDTVGEVGGHFGANLGTCELAVALHSLLDSPRDKILWDVGHQAYPHKVLTGRRDELRTIRQYGGLAPFLTREESAHDIMGAGHASTSVGYAVGIKEGMRLQGLEDSGGRVVAVIGDGAMTGGVAFEALNNAGHLQTPLVVVLNDNGMSISPNVGAVSNNINRIRLNPRLYKAREGLERWLIELRSPLGEWLERVGPRAKEAIKAFYAPGLLFEELEFAYVGVVDGHDVQALRRAIGKALEAGRPVLVHVRTIKGKGFAPAEEGGLEAMEKWHAAKPASIVNGRVVSKKPERPSGPPQWTEVFGRALVEEAKRDTRIVGITAAMAGGTGLSMLAKELPDRYFDVGIAEQFAGLFAAGLALDGLKPVVAIYSTFLQRAFDQIVHDIALQKLNVVFAMDRAGLVGDDGPTHHGVFDISYLRPLPNIVLMAPRDELNLVHMLHTALSWDDGPIALRYPRGSAFGVELPKERKALEIGKGEVLQSGDRVALIGYGHMVDVCRRAADLLSDGAGLRPSVVDARFAKPLDGAMIKELAGEHELLITVEENVLPGGFGSAVLEYLSQHCDGAPKLLRFGVPDRFVTHGKQELLRKEIGLTPESVAEAAAVSLGAKIELEPISL